MNYSSPILPDWLRRIIKNLLLIVFSVLITVWLIRGINSRSLPDVSFWHQSALSSEFHARDYPNGIDFSDYLKLERKLDVELRALLNANDSSQLASSALRYTADSPLNPMTYETNWNWSYVLEHTAPHGAIVLIHGASDSPYSMRAIAQRLNESGLVVIGIRLPGHGTIPGELTTANTQDWLAITQSAIVHARQILDRDKLNSSNPAPKMPHQNTPERTILKHKRPIYLAGYSMGAGLSLHYALDTLENDQLERPAGIVLISPAIAISPFVAFAKLDLWFSHIPGFEKFAWVDIRPEFDPYKYNSFPKQTGRQTYNLTTANVDAIERLRNTRVWKELPPIITFMSAVDATVSVEAVVSTLYRRIESTGSTLVLFGVNQSNVAMGFLKQSYREQEKMAREQVNRNYDLIVVSNSKKNNQGVTATTYCAKNSCISEQPLEVSWPNGVFSLSHVALPFAPNDPLYGPEPTADSPGAFTLGSLQPRGERGVLVIPTEDVMRLRYNPFFDFMAERITEFTTSKTSAPGDAQHKQ